mgnify:CR=1 FL=1
MTILITGATGNIGGEVVKLLARKNIPLRVMVRDPTKATHLKEQGIEVVRGDFLHPDTLDTALQGIEKAFLVTSNDLHQVEMESNFVRAAQRAGVQHIVKLSVMGAELDPALPSTFQQWHRLVERQIEASNMAWTHLRPNMFMQNMRWFAPTIAQQGAIYSTVGNTKISHVDARDVAAVAAICLSESGHENKSYTLTGTEAISFDEVAQKFSQALKRPVTYVNVAPSNLKAARLANGEPEWYLDAELQLFACWAEGHGSAVTDAIADIIHQLAITFDEFVQYYAQTRSLDFFNLERVATGFTFLEGPVCNASGNYLLFCDAQGDAIHKLAAKDRVEIFRQPAGNASGLAFDPQGRLVACENRDRRITRTEVDGSITVLADRYEGKRFNSPNDLTIRSDGSIYFTDPPYGLPEMSQGKELEFNGVYKISPDGQLSLQVKDLALPNGLVFSPDEKRLYINDSATRTIYCFDVQPDGTLTSDRVFAQMTGDSDDWNADGMAIDTEGNVYSAGPKGIWIFSPSGELKDRIYAPEVITNLAWRQNGNCQTLYLTGISSLYRIQYSIS